MSLIASSFNCPTTRHVKFTDFVSHISALGNMCCVDLRASTFPFSVAVFTQAALLTSSGLDNELAKAVYDPNKVRSNVFLIVLQLMCKESKIIVRFCVLRKMELL